MTTKIAPWNPIQFVCIAIFTIFPSFLLIPEGGMFMAALYVVLALLTVPVLFLQLKLGSYLQRGIVGILSMFFPIWKGVGIAALIDLLLRITNIAPIIAQFGAYGFISMAKHPFVWAYCNHVWNTQRCDNTTGPSDMLLKPEEEFYKNEFLQLSPGIGDIGGFPQWSFNDIARKAEVSLMPISLAIVWVLILLLVGFGGRVCGWVLFLLGPCALACLLAVLGYGYSHIDTGATVRYLRAAYSFHSDHTFLQRWQRGFSLAMNSLPVWTAMAATIGTMGGRGRTTRNTTWLIMVVMYGLFCQLPPLAMAPFLGSSFYNQQTQKFYFRSGPDILLWEMPHAFTTLHVDPVYVFLFYLSAFLFGLMFLCVGTLTIVHNLMDALVDWMDRKACSKVAVHLLMTLAVMALSIGLGILHTTRAGMYFYSLINYSIGRLQFVLIILMALGLLVVYVKQNFALAERIIMGLWFGIASVACAGIEFYVFMTTKDSRIEYHEYVHPWICNVLSWVIAALPFLGVLAGLIHAMVLSFSKHSRGCKHLWCGITERLREEEEVFHPPPPEPSAPPYAYTYMEHSYPLDDLHYKMDYEETDPLAPSNSTRI